MSFAKSWVADCMEERKKADKLLYPLANRLSNSSGSRDLLEYDAQLDHLLMHLFNFRSDGL